ncbi:hypothetical protein EJ08DRAFT_341431 [Tothia fuscella]|uniref:DUF1772-domain-containing protein n=1 Tax=Tothia fuscella TaxID=1048955 RepID=A0A9P4NZS0_9PEZI|nr:hypothetical protein EJ08DRAFT_341431 [Tothia fuscella]
MDSIRTAQILGITSTTFMAGSNALYSYNLIPTLLSHRSLPLNPRDEKQLISQWHHMFLIGFHATRAQSAIIALTYSFLTYKTYALDPFIAKLYIATGVICVSIVPYTITVQRALNASLVLRAEKLGVSVGGTNAEVVGRGEKGSVEMEGRYATVELVRFWGRYNAVRAVVGTVGAVIGIWTALEHASRRGGV